MPVIPGRGDLGQQAPQIQRMTVQGGSDAIQQGAQHLAGRLDQIATEQMQEAEQLGRVKAANALLDHEIRVKTAAAALKDDIVTGKIPYADGKKAYQDALAQLDPPDLTGIPKVAAEDLKRGMDRVNFAAGQEIDTQVLASQREDFKNQAAGMLDKLQKLAGMPNADVEAINRQAETAVGPLLQSAGLKADQAGTLLQNFKDQNWLNDATQKAMAARNDLGALQQLSHDLVDEKGYYAGKLDTNKRNAVLRSVQADIDRINNRSQHEADKREAKAGRVIDAIDRQIASGVPATSAMWADWASTVKGTPYEKDFQQRIGDERQVQDVLRMPIEDQVRFVQKQQQDLQTKGGSVREQANATRLATVVGKNVKQMQEAPLLFLSARTGQDFAPLDMTTLLQPGGGDQLRAQLEDRHAAIRSMRSRYGNSVQSHLLLPQEVQMLGAALDQGTPQQKSAIFSALHEASGSNESYVDLMRQLAPDQPVRALAGLIAGKQQAMTLEHHWLSADVTATGGDIARTLLVGEDILNKTKSQKAQDGKSVGFPLPPEKDFQATFSSAVGDAFAGNPQAFDVAMQAVRSYYTGKAAQDGDISGVVDNSRLRQAMTAVLGQSVDFNGSTVFAPWGMSGSAFEDAAHKALVSTMKQLGLPESAADKVVLRNKGDGVYLVASGLSFLQDKQGKPVEIRLGE